jgi:hypothetical protein
VNRHANLPIPGEILGYPVIHYIQLTINFISTLSIPGPSDPPLEIAIDFILFFHQLLNG